MVIKPCAADAHPAEQGFVLLLPTDLYIAGGVASVALTVVILMLLPPEGLSGFFRSRGRLFCLPWRVSTTTSLFGMICTVGLVWVGLAGSTDPLRNPLPLAVWTIWWIGLVAIQGLLGDVWSLINPLIAPMRLGARAGWRPLLWIPRRLGRTPGILAFLVLVSFLLADPTPTDPRRLAFIVGIYWLVSLVLLGLLGPRWLITGEVVTMLMRAYARAALFRQGRVGVLGWQILVRPSPSTGAAVLVLVLLGSGSFDGLNETFWWLATIGVNPLEFPGRSAIMLQTILGLLAMNVGLIVAFGAAVWLGHRLASGGHGWADAFRVFAPSILPIALGYHIGHYLPSFLVNIQYALAAASDPLGRGDDVLGLGVFYVTTGFFNTQATVRVIWLSQAGAVVVGHVIAILLAHGLAYRHYGDATRATRSQIPLATFMVIYTFFGLWLLASPRGV
ncbi:MAG: hypothetical protein AAGB18_00565 [Pseudomonadota bacterium]